MAAYLFNSGYLFLRDAGGVAYQAAKLKEVTLDLQTTIKDFRGQQQWDLAKAFADRKASIKAKSGIIDGKLLGSIYGVTRTAGRVVYATNVQYAASATITPAPTGTSFVADMGVVDQNSNPLTVTSSLPAVGAYSVSGPGVYTFNAGQTGNVFLSYAYNTGSGWTYSVNNQDMAIAPTYELHLQNPAGAAAIKFFAVVVPKLALALKSEDWAVQDLDLDVLANPGGQVFQYFEN